MSTKGYTRVGSRVSVEALRTAGADDTKTFAGTVVGIRVDPRGVPIVDVELDYAHSIYVCRFGEYEVEKY